MDSEEIVYGAADRSGVDLPTVERLTGEFVAEMLVAGSEAHAAAVGAGIDVDQFGVAGPSKIRFGAHEAGLTGIDIVIFFTSKMAYDAWKQILLPRINRKLNKGKLVEKEKKSTRGKSSESK